MIGKMSRSAVFLTGNSYYESVSFLKDTSFSILNFVF